MKIQTTYILTIMVLTLNYGQLNAAVFPTFEGDSSGLFSNAIGGSNVSITGQSVSWGSPAGFGGSSSLTYAGSNPFSINDSNAFNIATLTYLNTPIIGGTGISNVDLTVNLDFNNPAIGVFDFIVGLAIVNTTNSGSNNSDTVTFSPVSSFPSLLGSIDSINYFFTILGFRDSNGVIVNSFTQAENSTGDVDLIAQITAVNPVPVPTTFWLILTALAGISVFNSRRFVVASIRQSFSVILLRV